MATIDKEVGEFGLTDAEKEAKREAESTPDTAETVAALAKETSAEVRHQLDAIKGEPGKIDAEIKSVDLTPQEIRQIKAETGIDLRLQEIYDEAEATAAQYLTAKQEIIDRGKSAKATLPIADTTVETIIEEQSAEGDEKMSVSDAIQRQVGASFGNPEPSEAVAEGTMQLAQSEDSPLSDGTEPIDWSKMEHEEDILPNTEKESKEANDPRLITIWKAVQEFLKGDFEKSKEYRDYISKREELVSRGLIAEGDYPATIKDMEETLQTIFVVKRNREDFSNYVDAADENGLAVLAYWLRNEKKEYFPKGLKLHDGEMSDKEAVKLLHRYYAETRKVLDEKLFAELKKEAIPKRVIEKEQDRLDAIETAKADAIQKEKEHIEAVKGFYENIRGREEAKIATVEQILSSNDSEHEYSKEQLDALREWLNGHSEFGLSEMTEEEYMSFFYEGKVCAHITSFFGDITLEEKRYVEDPHPRFVKALEDGYLLPIKIGDERNEDIRKNKFPERNVSVDGATDLAKHLNDPEGIDRTIVNDVIVNMRHFHYGLTKIGAEGSPPVVLVAPERLLNLHSSNVVKQQEFNKVIDPQELEHFYTHESSNGKVKKFGEGEHYGSTEKNPYSKKHEIPLDIFTMVVPDIEVNYKFLKLFLEDLMKDNRLAAVRDQIQAEYDKEQTVEYIERINKKFNLKDILQSIMSNLKEAGVRVPHLNFYVPEKELKYSEKNAKYEAPEVLEARDEHTIRRGLQSFFDDHGVVLKPSTQSPQYCSKVDELQSLDYLDAEDIPEQFRLDRERLEETANKVRRILKQQNAASQPAA